MSLLRLDNYNMPGHELKIGASMDIRTTDASGDTSGTDEVENGFKPKKITVSLVIKAIDASDLTELTRVAEAKTNGERKIYTIVNKTANAMGIRQVRFAENFSVREKDGLRAWDISFTLKEYQSNPERVEQREPKPEPVAQVSEGTSTVTDTAALKKAEQEIQEMGLVEHALYYLDKVLA
ncbi:Nucleoid DNA-binding protein [Pseudodesulfovibrio profundus]|uniref:Nucleoid DNA-binding protein n=1 Tax=Pseudodesulfovibrio profundus TaxID=57320 RepID=A0A2C8FDM0_9BACT|nr:DNA-binding protein [Pseudodesulfovibrio profundus]MBC17023.1 DNA-binding protein [Desulfovibrio sp.]SOB60523.1 Nucleoid DNA-binding protein [Pseudodesulfovibrio profundus]|tara:strand:- start:2240 stop:2779 length:540 start_codon:yes stop_codon:yes gene_type:complete